MSLKPANQKLLDYLNAVEKLILVATLCIGSLCFVLSQPIGATPVGVDDFRITSFNVIHDQKHSLLEDSGYQGVERHVLPHDPINVWFISRKEKSYV